MDASDLSVWREHGQCHNLVKGLSLHGQEYNFRQTGLTPLISSPPFRKWCWWRTGVQQFLMHQATSKMSVLALVNQTIASTSVY